MNPQWHNINSKLSGLHEQLFRAIPSILHSFEHDGPFTHCISCNKELIKSGSSYLIEKVISRQEVLLEYAMCRDCMAPVREAFSEESTKAVQEFYRTRRKIVQDTSKCNLCLQPIDELIAYKIIGECSGNQLFSLNHPTLVCGMCQNELSQKISQRTKDNLEGFRDRIFPGPPEEAEPITTPGTYAE
jgi:uncharacterized protein with PIN domain